mgnify:CR=1 FL=1
MLDPEGRVTSWNTGAERIEGFQHEEIIRRAVCSLLPTRGSSPGFSRAGAALRRDQRTKRARRMACAQRRRALLGEHGGFGAARRTQKSGRLFRGDARFDRKKRVEEVLRESEDQSCGGRHKNWSNKLIASGRLVSLGVITASMAHGVQQSLRHRHGLHAAIVERVRGPTRRTTRRLKIIDEETKRCQRIIQELLQYSRPKNADLCPTDVKAGDRQRR